MPTAAAAGIIVKPCREGLYVMSLVNIIGNATYGLGNTGPTVQAIQFALRERGYVQLTGTGYFGTQTDTAVEDFQRRHGLDVDGVVGPATAAAIDAAAVAKPDSDVSKTPLWLTVSLDNVGLKEGAGAKDNKELISDIRTVTKDYQHDATPWCGGWAGFCLVKAGYKASSKPLWALSYSDVKSEPFVKLMGPALGAIAVKIRNGGGHVTFVAGRTRGGALACCGGNQNDMVNVSPYDPGVFIGYYWPKGAPMPKAVGFNTLPIVNTLGKPVSSEA